MIWGDQWLCPCGWNNFWLRARCRNCGEPRLPDEKLEGWQQVMENVHGQTINEEGHEEEGSST